MTCVLFREHKKYFFRSVVMIGLPFPNRQDPEIQERQSYLSAKHGAKAAQIYYQNLCMRAVNQSIGRAIR